MKYCKVNTTAFNPSRVPKGGSERPFHGQDISTEEKYRKMIKTLFEIEQNYDPGLEMDCYMVVYTDQNGMYKEWAKYHGQPIRRGHFYVLYEARDGGNYQMFNSAFQLLRQWYDWFLFTCDDILVLGDQYYKKIVDRWSDGVGYIALQGGGEPATPEEPQSHVQGSIGLTKREILDEVCANNNGELPHSKKEPWSQEMNIQEGEIPFTQRILYLGYHFINYNDSKKWSIDNLCFPYYDYIERKG